MNSWEQQAGENNLWFSRFEAYRMAGPERTLLGAFQTVTGKEKISGAWKDAAKKWKWIERAAAWDTFERERLNREYEQERETERLARRKLLKDYRLKLENALKELVPSDAKWNDVTAGLKMVTEELRKEYGDDNPVEHTGELTVKIVYADPDPTETAPGTTPNTEPPTTI